MNSKVYVKINDKNIITQINSDIFINNIDDWILIDEGNGIKYMLSQGNYLDKQLMDSQGNYNYKLVDNKPVEITEEEKASLFPINKFNAEENLIDKLILDNINMQTQIDSLIQASLGGN